MKRSRFSSTNRCGSDNSSVRRERNRERERKREREREKVRESEREREREKLIRDRDYSQPFVTTVKNRALSRLNDIYVYVYTSYIYV